MNLKKDLILVLPLPLLFLFRFSGPSTCLSRDPPGRGTAWDFRREFTLLFNHSDNLSDTPVTSVEKVVWTERRSLRRLTLETALHGLYLPESFTSCSPFGQVPSFPTLLLLLVTMFYGSD